MKRQEWIGSIGSREVIKASLVQASSLSIRVVLFVGLA
jgi:hypothetical protein